MKIIIDLEETPNCGLTPNYVYRCLSKEYCRELTAKHKNNFWGLENSCDRAARELYAALTNRPQNVKNLILTYDDAEACFKVYKRFADVWASTVVS